MEPVTKEPLIEIKDMDENDWRGIIAIIIVIGGFVMFAVTAWVNHPEWFSPIPILMYAVTDWYFKAKKETEVARNGNSQQPA